MRTILSVDGGGVRGALVACVLASLEKETGKLSREIFSMAAGTSTGAIIAASIAAGIPAEDIVRFYQEDAPKIFNLSPLLAWPARIAHGHAFDSQKIQDVLVKRFGAAANWSLNDSPIRLLLCACRVNSHEQYFVQDRPKNSQQTGKLSLVECTTASAAAPTYLSPEYVSPLGGALVGWCVDGGISGMSNPVYHACVEATVYDDFDPADTAVISLGTGFYRDSAVNPPAGFIGALTLSLDSLLYNAGRQQTQIAQRHFPGMVQRFNWEIPISIDMADAGAIPNLIDIGRKVGSEMDWERILRL